MAIDPVGIRTESGAGDETIRDIAGHVSKQMLKHYSHIRMEAKRLALEVIVAKKADAKPAEEEPAFLTPETIGASGSRIALQHDPV